MKQEKTKVNKDKNGENVPHLEIIEVVLLHCNIVNNDYQQDSRVLYTFNPNKSIDQLFHISTITGADHNNKSFKINKK